MKKIVAGLFLVCLSLPAYSESSKQVPLFITCDKAGVVEERLMEDHSEVPIGIGVGGVETLAYSLWASKEGTFSVTATHVSAEKKTTCLVLNGYDWTEIEPKAAGKDN